MRTILTALLMTLAKQACSDNVRAHVQCFTNLTQYLFTVEMRNTQKRWEEIRWRHWYKAIEIGRVKYANVNDVSVDLYLGGYFQRISDGQAARLQCDNPENYMSFCSKWASYDEEILSQIGMKFYERENCGRLLN